MSAHRLFIDGLEPWKKYHLLVINYANKNDRRTTYCGIHCTSRIDRRRYVQDGIPIFSLLGARKILIVFLCSCNGYLLFRFNRFALYDIFICLFIIALSHLAG